MDTMSWKEVIDLLKLYKEAVESENEEELVHICNMLPDEIQIWGDDVLIKI